jgi:hypothetical protein
MLETRERLKRAAMEVGLFNDDRHTARCVRDEMGLFASLEFALFCQSHVYAWRKEKNPYYIDLIMMGCKQFDIMPPPALLAVIAETATARFDGDPSGTAAKVMNDNFRGQAITLMLNLIYAGDKLGTAASKAAQWYSTTFPSAKRLKASHLERLYSDQYRKTGIEKEHFSEWDIQSERRENEGLPQYWQKVREVLPMADDELAGNRRQ